MKKFIICFVILVFCSLAAFSQEGNVVNFKKLPETKFPCTLRNEIDSTDTVTFWTPVELSKYCSDKAYSNLSSFQGCLIGGLCIQALGAGMYGYYSLNHSDATRLVGAIAILGGAVCEVVAMANLIGHFKWEYSRKRVDMYLMPNGATIKF